MCDKTKNTVSESKNKKSFKKNGKNFIEDMLVLLYHKLDKKKKIEIKDLFEIVFSKKAPEKNMQLTQKLVGASLQEGISIGIKMMKKSAEELAKQNEGKMQ